MKAHITGTALVLAALTIASCGKSIDTGKKLSTPVDSFSYMLGLRTALSYKMEGLKEIDYSSFARGFEDGIKKDSGYAVPEKSANRVFQGDLQQLRSAAEKDVKAKTTKWLEENKKKGVSELPSKAQFKTTKRGTGQVPTLDDTVVIHFKVKDVNGKLMQNTEERGAPLSIPAKYIPIEGLREWITQVPAGSEGTLYIPGPLPGFEAGSVEEEFSVFVWEMKFLTMNPGPTLLDPKKPAMPGQGPKAELEMP
jgi:FKBP-type peptidyl-prolyl cis-trans isomerase